MCNSVEEYATQRAIDAVIKACVDFGRTMEETIKYITSKFDNATAEYIATRYSQLSKKHDD